MKNIIKYFFIFFLTSLSVSLCGQTDEDPPESPVFRFVTINPSNNRTEMTWSLSPDLDVAGYVVYLYSNGEGYAIDTIFDPAATNFSVFRPKTAVESESYVIAAIDSSGNISPLSNSLHTIDTDLNLDICFNRINISWNKYNSIPEIKVTGYNVFVSVNGGTYYLAGQVSDAASSFVLNDVTDGSQYRFVIKAILDNGLASSSNKPSVDVNTQNNPKWINADYATVNESGVIDLSFTIDPASEIDTFAVEKRAGYSGQFQKIALVTGVDIKTVKYSDKTSKNETNNFYRLSAVKCNKEVIRSNIASNMVLADQNTGSEIILRWNQYHDWLGTVSSYRLFTDTGQGFSETAIIEEADTTYSISIPDIMYSLTKGEVCFYVSAIESGNPFGLSGESSSNRICSDIEKVITVPNVFTPDGDLKNDLFRPVLTFTPVEYRLLISNRQGKTLFDTDDFMEPWDGKEKGKSVAEGVYLWFIRLTAPDGKKISRTGTVTVAKN